MKRRGMTLVEALIGITLGVSAMFVFLTVFRSSYQHASMTRNRAVAVILARSMMDEFEAHTYGAPAPDSWKRLTEEPARIAVEGNQVTMEFTKTITYENGSFVDENLRQNTDVVRLQIQWREGVGDAQAKNATREEVKELVVRVPVWR